MAAVEALEDDTITHIKATKKTRYQLKVISSIKGETAQDSLAQIVDKEYNKKFKEK